MSDRIGSIRHIYRPGYYRAEIKLGGYEIQKNLPDTYSEINLDQAIEDKLAELGDIRQQPQPVEKGGGPSGWVVDPGLIPAPTPIPESNANKLVGGGSSSWETGEFITRYINPSSKKRGGGSSGWNTINLPEKTADEITKAIVDDILKDIE